MTWKDEFLIICVLCVVVVAFVVRHFFGGALYLVQHLAAFTLGCTPALLHLLVVHLR
ncbi:MAG: hypothetical protein WBG02_19400 [Candidatus Acidiferrum sp.]